MFNYQARQIFVIHPRNAGGGLLAYLFSLDSRAAAINFKKQSLEEKLRDWYDFVQRRSGNAHVHGFINFGHNLYMENVAQADHCDCYVHKSHFYEMFENQNSLLQMMPHKESIGLYLTENCIEQLVRFRPNTPKIDYYQMWVYANQKSLLQNYFSINCRHWFTFSDLLNLDRVMDHLAYCRDLFTLDTDLAVYSQIIKQWYTLIK